MIHRKNKFLSYTHLRWTLPNIQTDNYSTPFQLITRKLSDMGQKFGQVGYVFMAIQELNDVRAEFGIVSETNNIPDEFWRYLFKNKDLFNEVRLNV